MDTEIVEYILKNRRENKLMSREEIEEEVKLKVVELYRDYIDFEPNKENVYETLEKLKQYQYCNSIEDISKGDYIRFISDKYFYDIKLNLGGFVENIKKDVITLVGNNRYIKIKFSNNSIYKKLNDQDLLKLELIELLEKN